MVSAGSGYFINFFSPKMTHVVVEDTITFEELNKIQAMGSYISVVNYNWLLNSLYCLKRQSETDYKVQKVVKERNNNNSLKLSQKNTSESTINYNNSNAFSRMNNNTQKNLSLKRSHSVNLKKNLS